MGICADKSIDYTLSTERIKEILEANGYNGKRDKGLVYSKPGCHDIKIVEGFRGGHLFRVNGWMLTDFGKVLERSGERQ